MKKRLLPLFLVLAMVLGLSAQAATPRIPRVTLSLTFSGTTANCEATVISANDSIDVTIELWCGSTKLDSWSASGKNVVSVSGTYGVTKGTSYTLKASGTIDGSSFTGTPITKPC